MLTPISRRLPPPPYRPAATASRPAERPGMAKDQLSVTPRPKADAQLRRQHLENAVIMESVYRNTLGREVDDYGKAFWPDLMQQWRAEGLSNDAIGARLEGHLKDSDEYRARMAPPPPAPEPPTPRRPTGPDPAQYIGRRDGDHCVVFVEKVTGHYFAVDSARQMLDPGKHPGYDVVKTPQPGDIFVKTNGGYGHGHTGFVESVDPVRGTITVIDSNAQWDGNPNRVDGTVRRNTYPMSAMGGYLRRNDETPTPYGKRM